MKYLQYILAIGLITLSAVCFALDLQTAKNQGSVGETPSGYLSSPTGSASAVVEALMNDINKKRQVKYTEIAVKIGKPLNVVEKLAGEKAIGKTKPGLYIQQANGNWVKK